MTGSDRSELRSLPACANEQQIRVKETRFSFAQSGRHGFGPAIAIAQELLEGSVHRVCRRRVADLRLHHHQRDAVHEKHDVRDDAALHAARRVDAELVDRMKDISFRVDEVDQLRDRIRLARDLIHIHLRLEEELLHLLVGLQERATGVSQELVAKVIDLPPGQPFLTVCRAVQGTNRLPEHLRQKPFAKAHAQARPRIAGDHPVSLIHDRPAQCCKLVQEGLFDVEVFGHSGCR